MRTTLQQLEDLKEWSQDSTRYERRLNFRGGQLVQPGQPGVRQGYAKKFTGANQAGTYVTANKPGRPLETKPLTKKEIIRLKKNLPEGITMHETSSGVWNYRFKIQKGKEKIQMDLPVSKENLKILVDERATTEKRLFPNRLSDEEFKILRESDKYINYTAEEFANIKELKNKTTKSGNPWTTSTVQKLQTKLDLTEDIVGSREYRTLDEARKIVAGQPGMKHWLKTASDSDILKQATQIIHRAEKSARKSSFPFGNTKEEKLWNSFWRSAKQNGRIEIVGEFADDNLPRDKSGKLNWKLKDKNGVPAWKRVKFKDTEVNATFKWGNLKNQVDEALGSGSFSRATSAYDQQAIMANKTFGGRRLGTIFQEGLLKKELETILGRKVKAGSQELKDWYKARKPSFSFSEVHHTDGVAANPYKTESSYRYANRKANDLQRTYNAAVKYAERTGDTSKLKKAKNLFVEGMEDVSADLGGIRTKIGTKYVGEKATEESIIRAAAKGAGFNKNTVNQIFKAYRANGIGGRCPVKKAEGGRIGFAEAGVVDDNCMRNAINEHKRKLADGNEAAIKKQLKINQTKSLKNILNVGSRGLRGLTSIIGGWGGAAIEAAVEAGFYGYGLQQGESHEQARENLFLPKILAKYAPDLWEKFGGKPFKTGVWEGPEKLIEEELLAGNEQAQAYTQGIKALEDEYANASKIDFELGILNNQWRPGSEEEIEAKEQELRDSYDRIEELQINIKEGTPAHDAYVAAQEKQKALQDERAQDYYGDSPAYKGSKQRQWQKEFLDYRGADRKYRKEQPFAFKGGLEGSITGPNQFIDWDAYADYGWDKPEQKWSDLYQTGGWDLMDKIGIAGGVANMAGGGIAGIRRPWAIPPESGPMPQGGGLSSQYNRVKKLTE